MLDVGGGTKKRVAKVLVDSPMSVANEGLSSEEQERAAWAARAFGKNVSGQSSVIIIFEDGSRAVGKASILGTYIDTMGPLVEIERVNLRLTYNVIDGNKIGPTLVYMNLFAEDKQLGYTFNINIKMDENGNRDMQILGEQ